MRKMGFRNFLWRTGTRLVAYGVRNMPPPSRFTNAHIFHPRRYVNMKGAEMRLWGIQKKRSFGTRVANTGLKMQLRGNKMLDNYMSKHVHGKLPSYSIDKYGKVHSKPYHVPLTGRIQRRAGQTLISVGSRLERKGNEWSGLNKE